MVDVRGPRIPACNRVRNAQRDARWAEKDREHGPKPAYVRTARPWARHSGSSPALDPPHPSANIQGACLAFINRLHSKRGFYHGLLEYNRAGTDRHLKIHDWLVPVLFEVSPRSLGLNQRPLFHKHLHSCTCFSE